MNKTKVALLSLGMALCVGGGIGAAIAFTNNGTSKNGATPTSDEAIQLFWGSKSSTATIDNITGLTFNEAQYRYLSVTPYSTKSVAGTVTLTFTLETVGTKGVLTGLTVDVYKTTALGTDATVETLIDGVTAEPSLSASSTTGTTAFTVTATGAEGAAHETEAFYAIKVAYDGSDLGEGNELTAKLTIAQSFAKASA